MQAHGVLLDGLEVLPSHCQMMVAERERVDRPVI